ncbi:hypothetical protein [Actinomadura atramentaria]|nr:hypothetical protein [Actinomadura atramentaria]
MINDDDAVFTPFHARAGSSDHRGERTGERCGATDAEYAANSV